MSHPDEDSASGIELRDAVRHFDVDTQAAAPDPIFDVLCCAVCRESLLRGQRRVHPGECARARKTALQRRRRQRGGR
jgi:hypothetical protein